MTSGVRGASPRPSSPLRPACPCLRLTLVSANSVKPTGPDDGSFTRFAGDGQHRDDDRESRPLASGRRARLGRGIRQVQAQHEHLREIDGEIDQTLTYEQARQEAARCMSCGLCFDCQQCFMYCNQSGFTRIEKTRPGRYFAMALEACEGCGKCIEICPCGYLEPRDEDAGAVARGQPDG